MIVHKVVDSHGLEFATRDGWTLEQVIVATRGGTVQCQTPVSKKVPDGCYGDVQNYSRDEVVQVIEPMFLLKKEMTVITREEQLQAEMRLLNEKMTALKLKSDNDDRDLRIQREQIEGFQERMNTMVTSAQEARTRMQKLEGDLAKVRTAIGTKAYDEAIK